MKLLPIFKINSSYILLKFPLMNVLRNNVEIYKEKFNKVETIQADVHAEIRAIHKQLILKLDKPERRLLLQLIDTKDHLLEELSMDSFVCGFQLACQLANELNNYPESGRPIRSAQTGQGARCA